jgi:hypothetical protein
MSTSSHTPKSAYGFHATGHTANGVVPLYKVENGEIVG